MASEELVQTRPGKPVAPKVVRSPGEEAQQVWVGQAKGAGLLFGELAAESAALGWQQSPTVLRTGSKTS